MKQPPFPAPVLRIIMVILLLTLGPIGLIARWGPAVRTLPSGTGMGSGRVVVVLMSGVGWQDFHRVVAGGRAPGLARVVRRGAMGLINTRTAHRTQVEDAYLTLGAGTRAGTSAETAGLGLGIDERFENSPAGLVYRRRTGEAAVGARVVHLGIARLWQDNERLDHQVPVGGLGGVLRASGLPTAVIGNADVPGERNRWAATVAMDGKGRIDLGAVDEGLTHTDPLAPYGLRTDWAAMTKAFQDAWHQGARMMVVEPGDLLRLELYRDHLLPSRYLRLRDEFILELDAFVGETILSQIDPSSDLVLLVDAVPRATDLEGERTLTPVVAAGPGFAPGFLSSATTRRPGLAANVDLAPTVLGFFGLPVPPAMTGRTIVGVGGVVTADSSGGVDADVLGRLDAFEGLLAANEGRRWLMIRGYILVQLLVLLGTVAGFWLWPARLESFRPLVFSLTVVPLSFLLLPFFPARGIVASFMVTGLMTAGLTWLVLRLGRRSWVDPFIIICLATAGALLADVSTGGRLMLLSPLGYSPAGGARYYGIGNEYLGILLGAAVVGGTALLDRWPGNLEPRLLVTAFLAWAVLAVASPGLGANLGGTTAGALTVGYVGLRIWRRRVGWKGIALALLTTLAILVAVAAADLGRGPAAESHVARAMRLAAATGGTGLLEIIQRKVAMNLKLIRLTVWSKVFLSSLGTFALLFYRPPGVVRQLTARHESLGIGFIGILIGSLAVLAANDSGIVAAGTTMIYATATLLYGVLAEGGTRN